MEAEKLLPGTGGPARIAYLDGLRVVSMFGVMVLHLAAGGQQAAQAGTYAWGVCWGYNLLSRFAVPVFVMISGAIFLDPHREVTVAEIVKKRIPKLAGTFFIWSALYALAETAKSCTSFSLEYSLLVLQKTITGHYHMWYLYMLMGLYLATPFLRKISADRRLLGLFILLCFLLGSVARLLCQIPGLGSVAEQVAESADLSIFTGYAGYYCLGFFLHQGKIPQKYRIPLLLAAVLSMAAALCGPYFDVQPEALLDVKMPHIALYSSGVFLLFRENAARFERSGVFRRLFKTLTPCTLGMYLLHPAVNFLLRRAGIHALIFDPLLWLLPYSMLVCAVCWGCIFLVRKVPLLRRFV